MLVLGKGGSGKSALINSLRGITDREGPEAAPESNEGISVTEDVRCYVARKHGLEFELYDTPGLGDRESARQVIDRASDIISGDGNVVLFCIALSRGLRIDDSCINQISFLAETFGHKLWPQIIFVLTFAESVSHGQRELKIKNVTEQLTHAMLKVGVDKAIADSVPCLPSDYGETQKDWHDKIFDACCEREMGCFVFPPIRKKRAIGLTTGYFTSQPYRRAYAMRPYGFAIAALVMTVTGGAFLLFGQYGLIGALVLSVLGGLLYMKQRND